MDEHQQDANSALMELDKGLRAHKVGEQCEAIVRFPSLFTRFPFPILINSAFLKLADAFRNGNNFMRLCIVRVAQQSTKHLDKILNVDEFMKRIYMVIHSNDPYARALTLRMLGSVSCIISEKKNAHHSVQQGLDSHDRIEQEAAIFATTQFASHSHNFASTICNKLSSMLQGLSTPLEVKLKLIPVMQHMHYDVQISSKARSILQDLLPSYPAQDFVLTTLNTLTQLSLHTLVDIPEQVSLLLKYFKCDPREAVKSESLQNLNVLAKSAPHLWTDEDSCMLCEAFKLSTLSNSLKRGIIRVLCSLAESSSLIKIKLDEDSPILQLCQQCCYDLDLLQAALAAKLYCSLIKFASKLSPRKQASLEEEVLDATDALLLLLAPTSENNSMDSKALKIVLSSLPHLCTSCKEADARIVRTLITLLSSGDVPVYSETSRVMLETLAGITSTSRTPGLLSAYNSKLFTLLRTSVETDADATYHQSVKALICTVMFISNQEQGKSLLNNRLIDRLDSSGLDHWHIYRIARQACRMGQLATASQLFSRISSSVASEQHYFWLVALSDMTRAESMAVQGVSSPSNPSESRAKTVTCLHDAIQLYHQAITYLTAAVTPNHTLSFQCEFARLRCETLQAHVQLLNACSLVRSCPSPAISSVNTSIESTSSVTKSSVDNTILWNRMKSCASFFLNIERSYSELHMTSFDSDPRTLSILDMLQQSCSIMAYAIDVLVLSKSSRQASSLRNIDSSTENEDDDHYTKALKKAFANIIKSLQEIVKSENNSQPFSHLHSDCLIRCSFLILAVSHSFPRYFFQSLQTTNIKLAISPNQHSSNDHVLVEITQQLALKVEGVIQHENVRSSHAAGDSASAASGGKVTSKTKFRNVEKIKLTLKKNKQGAPKRTNVKENETKNSLEQIVDPHNDYFSTQFLLDFPTPGIFNVQIETNVKDDQGVWWKTGPKETISIKSYDDSARFQQASRSTRT